MAAKDCLFSHTAIQVHLPSNMWTFTTQRGQGEKRAFDIAPHLPSLLKDFVRSFCGLWQQAQCRFVRVPRHHPNIADCDGWSSVCLAGIFPPRISIVIISSAALVSSPPSAQAGSDALRTSKFHTSMPGSCVLTAQKFPCVQELLTQPWAKHNGCKGSGMSWCACMLPLSVSHT